MVPKVPQVASYFPSSSFSLFSFYAGSSFPLPCYHLSLSRWAGTDSQAEDEWWDYCSPSKHRTRFFFIQRGSVKLPGNHNLKCSSKRLFCQKCVRNKTTTILKFRYNEPCREPCASRGESYFWCYTASSWDYCSPEPDIVQETRTKSGFLCNGICDKMSSSYFFCEMKMATGWSWWDYCTKN